MDLFLKHHIFTKEEIHSRYEILLENYVKTIQLESKTMQEMLSKDFLPAVSRFAGEVSRSVLDKKALLPSIKAEKELALVESLTAAYETLSEGNDKLKALTEEVSSMESMQEAATFCHDKVLALMDELRVVADEAENGRIYSSQQYLRLFIYFCKLHYTVMHEFHQSELRSAEDKTYG